MANSATLLAFVTLALVVLVLPGPGVMYVVTRSLGQGYRAGLASVAGLSAGAFVHVLAATAGLSAILLTSATAFTVVKTIGAAYLIYLGIQTLLSRQAPADIEVAKPLPLRRVFVDGVVVSVFNPKIAVFFLAFLPQFVEPGGWPVAQQVFLLGTLYVMLALLTDSAYVLLAGSVRERVGSGFLHGRWPGFVSGTVYLGLGINTALTGRGD